MHTKKAIHAWSLGICLLVGLGCFQKDSSPGDTGSEGHCDGLDSGNDDTGENDTAVGDTAGADTGAEDTGAEDTAAVDTGGDTGGDTGVEVPEDAMPDWNLVDINPNSPTCNESISPRDYLQKTSGWYFMHAT